MKVQNPTTIQDLEAALGYQNGRKIFDSAQFDKEIFQNRYPQHVKRQIESNRTVLFNSINIKKMTQSEIALLYSKDFSGTDAWKDEREKIESQYAKLKESEQSKIEEGESGFFEWKFFIFIFLKQNKIIKNQNQ